MKSSGEKTFGSIGTKEISQALKKNNLEIPEKMIHLSSHIKSLGSFPVEIEFFPEIKAKIEIFVSKE